MKSQIREEAVVERRDCNGYQTPTISTPEPWSHREVILRLAILLSSPIRKVLRRDRPGNNEFAPLELTSEHEFVETALELTAQNAEDVKSISPIGRKLESSPSTLILRLCRWLQPGSTAMTHRNEAPR